MGSEGAGAVPARAILQTAAAEESATITAGAIIGEEYHIMATGHLDESMAAILFTVKLARVDRVASEAEPAEETSYRVRTAAHIVPHLREQVTP